MSLDSVLNSSASGLDSVSRRIATVSQNVANAGTAGYVRQTVAVSSAAAARFDELNPDGDDALDEREAAPVLPGEAFRAADTDKNGTVSKAEYLAYVEQMFNAANPDKDGSLDRAELDSKAGQALMKMLR